MHRWQVRWEIYKKYSDMSGKVAGFGNEVGYTMSVGDRFSYPKFRVMCRRHAPALVAVICIKQYSIELFIDPSLGTLLNRIMRASEDLPKKMYVFYVL